MATNLDLDDAFSGEAQTLGCHKTKKAAVTAALEEYVGHRKRLEFLNLAGTIDIDPTYDDKAGRRQPRFLDLFTVDSGFTRLAAILPIRLHDPSGRR